MEDKCEVHYYLMGDGRCTCKPTITKKKDLIALVKQEFDKLEGANYDWISFYNGFASGHSQTMPKFAEIVEIQTNPDTSFFFSHVRTNKEVPDDEVWVSYKNGKLQKFKLL